MKQFLSVISHFLPLKIVIIGLAVLIYASAQQIYRQSLNDPQVEIVGNMQIALLLGAQPVDIVGRAQMFDVSKSLTPFIAVFDESGNVLESTATVGTTTLHIPEGVLAYAKEHGENRVTWEPVKGTRIALVVRPVAIESGWFVASGRNMKETEMRINDIGKMIAIGTIIILIVGFFFDYLGDVWRRKIYK